MRRGVPIRAPELAAQAIALDGIEEFPDVADAEAWVRQSDAYDRSWFATGTFDGRTSHREDSGWRGTTERVRLRLANNRPLVSMF